MVKDCFFEAGRKLLNNQLRNTGPSRFGVSCSGCASTRASAPTTRRASGSGRSCTVDDEERELDDAIVAALKKDISKARIEELERIRVQTIEVFGDIYFYLAHEMKAVVQMHTDWQAVRTSWDVIRRLEIIEDRVCGNVHTSMTAGRDQAEMEMAALRQRNKQSVSFKDTWMKSLVVITEHPRRHGNNV